MAAKCQRSQTFTQQTPSQLRLRVKKSSKRHRSTCNVVTICANKTQPIPARTSTTCVMVSNGVWKPDHDIEQGVILDIGVDKYMNYERYDHTTVRVLIHCSN